jgi:hypothetical protein
MFKTLYRCPRTAARHENGPLAESRRSYLEHLAAQGAANHTIRAAAGIIYRATMMMKLDESSPVERKDVENHELGEEIVASYVYQVHLYEWLETNDYGRFLVDNDL